MQADASYDQFEDATVYQCRIGVHSLGPLTEGAKSKNHATLYLLIGSGYSVLVDMVPRDGRPYSNLVGVVQLRAHSYTLSNGIIRHADIDARSCPPNFNPDARYNARPSDAYSVRQFVQALTEKRLDRYRFIYMWGNSDGCRFLM